jgi:hypothetical protein
VAREVVEAPEIGDVTAGAVDGGVAASSGAVAGRGGGGGAAGRDCVVRGGGGGGDARGGSGGGRLPPVDVAGSRAGGMGSAALVGTMTGVGVASISSSSAVISSSGAGCVGVSPVALSLRAGSSSFAELMVIL